MLKRQSLWLVVFVVATLFAIGAIAGTSFAQKTVPMPPDKLALGGDDIKNLLLLMDTDKNRKISKQEWMNFMSAEFNRMDKDKSGQLDPKELAESRLKTRTFASVGK